MRSNQEAKAIAVTPSVKLEFIDLVKLIKTVIDREDVKANREIDRADNQVSRIMLYIYWELFKDSKSRNKYHQMHDYVSAKYINRPDSIIFFTSVMGPPTVQNEDGVYRLPEPVQVDLDDAKQDVKAFSSPIELITIPQFFEQSNADAKSENYAEDVKLLCETRYESFYKPTEEHPNVLGFIVSIETIIKEIWPRIYENILDSLESPCMERVSNKMQAFFQEMSVNYRGLGLSMSVGVFPIFALTGLVERARLANVAFRENKLTEIMPSSLQGIVKAYANVPVRHYSNEDINTLEAVISGARCMSHYSDSYIMTFPAAQSKEYLTLVTDYFNTILPRSSNVEKQDDKLTPDEKARGEIVITNRALLQHSLFADLKESANDHPELVSKFREMTLLRSSISGLVGGDSGYLHYERRERFSNLFEIEKLEENPESYSHPFIKEMLSKKDKALLTPEVGERIKKLLEDPDNYIHPILAYPVRIDKLRTYVMKNGLQDEKQLKGLIADIRACQEQCQQRILQDFRNSSPKVGLKENQKPAEIIAEVQAISEKYKSQCEVFEEHSENINKHLKQIELHMHNKFVLNLKEVPDESALTYRMF